MRGLCRCWVHCRLAKDRLALVGGAESGDVPRVIQMDRPRFAGGRTAGSFRRIVPVLTTVGGLVLGDDSQVGQVCSRCIQISAIAIEADVIAVLEAAKLNA